jgi:hypothetical protein
MSDDANLPKLADGAAISVTRHIRYHLDCPKCRKPLDVTDLAFGTILKCPGCKNITWRPQFQPKWYFRARNFVLAIIGSFILGILSNFASSFLWERYFQTPPVSAGQPTPAPTNHP